MSETIDQLGPHLEAVIAALSPAERRGLTRDIARELRAGEQRRIAAQRNPDGTPYAPRKPRLRAKAGRIRRALFAKLRTTRYLRVQSSADEAVVEITGRAARIAEIHQYGLSDRVAPGGPEYRYPERRILGFTDAARAAIADRVLDHLTRRAL